MLLRACKWCGLPLSMFRWIYLGFCPVCTHDLEKNQGAMSLERGGRLDTNAIIKKWLRSSGLRDK